MLVLLAEALPSSAPAIPDVIGATKIKFVFVVHTTSARKVAFVLKAKSRRSSRASVPNRYCSPVNEMVSCVKVLPVPLVNIAPRVVVTLPD